VRCVESIGDSGQRSNGYPIPQRHIELTVRQSRLRDRPVPAPRFFANRFLCESFINAQKKAAGIMPAAAGDPFVGDESGSD